MVKKGSDYFTIILYNTNGVELNRFVGVYKHDIMAVEPPLFDSYGAKYMLLWNKSHARIDKDSDKNGKIHFINIKDAFFYDEEVVQ